MTHAISLNIPRLPVPGWHVFRGAREAELPSLVEASHHLLTTSGRAAILAALRALKLAPGERVLLPTYHCPTMIAPAVMLGGVPLFYPLEACGAPDLRWIAAQDLRGVRALLAAHFFGLPQAMRALRAFCNERGIALIEDCAHAFFGITEGAPIGSFGDFAIGSLTKFFPVSEGGLLIARAPLPVRLAGRSVRDEAKALIDALETGAAHAGFTGANGALRIACAIKRGLRAAEPPMRAGGGPDAELLAAPRAPTRLTRWLFRAAHQARIISRRRENYLELCARLSGHAGIAPLKSQLPSLCVPYVMPLYADRPDSLYGALRAQRVPVFRWCQRWPGTPQIAGDVGEKWSRHVLQLGCHQDLSTEDIRLIADCVIEAAS